MLIFLGHLIHEQFALDISVNHSIGAVWLLSLPFCHSRLGDQEICDRNPKTSEAGNVGSKAPRIIHKYNDMLTTW